MMLVSFVISINCKLEQVVRQLMYFYYIYDAFGMSFIFQMAYMCVNYVKICVTKNRIELA